MKIQKLRMREFMVYRDETIDFTKFQHGQLFLVTGPTGSGKTTIFDAICFAFYGKASTKTRGDGGDEDLISKLPDVEPKDNAVSLWFSAKGKNYRIHRIAKHVYTTNRNTQSEKNQQVELYEVTPTGEKLIGESKSERDQMIQELVGLDVEQFRKIVMLPQAEFSQFLKANSNEKESILKQIFPIDIYTRFAETVKAERQAENERGLQLQKGLESAWSLRLQQTADDLETKGERADRDAVKASTEMPQYAEQWNAAVQNETERLNTLASVISEKSKALDESQSIVRKLETQKTTAKQHNERLERFHTAAKNFEESEKSLATRKEQRKELELLNASTGLQMLDREVLRNQLSFADLTQREKQSQESFAQAKTAFEKALAENKYSAEDWAQDFAKKEASLRAEKEKRSTQLRAKTELTEVLRDAYQKMDRIHATLERREEVKVSLDADARALETARTEAENARKALQTAEEALQLTGLSQYADRLAEGEACPLCGATHHPSPYHSDPETAKRAEDAKKNSREKDAAVIRLQTAIDSQKKEQGRLITSTQEDYQSFAQTIEKADTLQTYSDTDPQDLESPWHTEKFAKTVMAQIAKRGKSLREEIDGIEKEKDDMEDALETLRQSWTAVSNLEHAWKMSAKEAENVQQQLETASKNVTESKARYEEERAKLFESEETFRALLQKADALRAEKDAVETFFHDRETNQMTMDLLSDCRGQEPIDLEKLDASYNEALQQYQTIDKAVRQLETALQKDEGILRQVKVQLPALAEAEKRKRQLGDLYELVNGGKLSGTQNQKVTLEAFVLGTYFDRILGYANVRLDQISHGQYALVRKEEQSSRGGKQGLDIEVIDNNLSLRRAPSSLSGGETFFVSLSLALGLADEVSATKGLFDLEHLFIDEGFGSLDPDTLQSAMFVLKSLSQGDKLIGIISHVEAFKQEIENRIEVTKRQDGSASIEVVAL